jgi:hypothetical protein
MGADFYRRHSGRVFFVRCDWFAPQVLETSVTKTEVSGTGTQVTTTHHVSNETLGALAAPAQRSAAAETKEKRAHSGHS